MNYSHPIELNRYGYAAGNPVNLSDPSGNQALAEYMLQGAKWGAILGGAAGGLTSMACGGGFGDIVFGIVSGALLGSAAGAVFDAGFAYRPGLTLGIGIIISGGQSVHSAHEFFTNMSLCTGTRAAIDLAFFALSLWGVNNYIHNDLLGGLGQIGYPDEMLNPAMGHDGYYSGEYQPIIVPIGGYSFVGYHGTSSISAEAILKNGISSPEASNFPVLQLGKGFYTTNDIGAAYDFARIASMEKGGEPVVLKIYARDFSNMIGMELPDYMSSIISPDEALITSVDYLTGHIVGFPENVLQIKFNPRAFSRILATP